MPAPLLSFLSGIRYPASSIVLCFHHPSNIIRHPIFRAWFSNNRLRNPYRPKEPLDKASGGERYAKRYLLKIRASLPKPLYQNPISSIQYPASNIQHPISSIQHLESGIRYPASSIRDYKIPLFSSEISSSSSNA